MNKVPARTINAAADFLAGGGEMGARIRAFDWFKTPLGPTAEWPQSLRSALSILLSSRAQIILFWGPDLVALYNDAYAPTFGSKHPWALGKPARECWAEVWEDTLNPLFSGVLRSGEAFYAQDYLFFLERHGYLEETYYDVSYDPVRVEGGAVGGIFCIVSDRTGRVLERRRLQTLRELTAQSLSEAKSDTEVCQVAAKTIGRNDRDVPFALIYTIDADRKTARLVAASGIAMSTPNSPMEVPLGSDSNISVWPLDKVASSNRAELIDTSQIPDLPTGAWDDPPRSALILPVAAPGQELPTALLVAAISPRRPLDDVYQNFYNTIAAHISAALANVRAYNQERKRAEALAELDRAKTAFFSNISHEFRTPLTLMLGPLEDTLAGADALPPADRERLEVAHRNSMRLLKLVNTMLDFSRIEAGRIQASYEPTDLAALTAELSSVFRSAIEHAGLQLVVNCPPLAEDVYVDREMWEKIVLNLLSNAFKFTFEGEIEVSLRQAGEMVELAVRDTGTGIPADELPHVFERFHRIKGARGRTYEGSGIGLALVQELAKLHGGAACVESVVGRGSTFTVTIPRGKDHLPVERIGAARTMASTGLRGEAYIEEALRWLPEETMVDGQWSEPISGELPTSGETDLSSDHRPPTTTHRARILLADDNADMREYLRRLLASSYDVSAVADGREALKAAFEQKPDLILADVMMPNMDGVALSRALRENRLTVSIPIIMLSARAGEEARVEGMEAGADDYLVKPFSARELLARVGARLEITRIRNEAEAKLRESEERLRMALNAGKFGNWQLDLTDLTLTCSKQCKANFGRTSEEPLTYEMLRASVHPEDQEMVEARMSRAIEEVGDYEADYRYVWPDGSLHWISDRGRALGGENGHAIRMVGVTLDITERKQAEEALSYRSAQYETLLNQAPLGVYLVDADFRIRDVNPTARPVFGDIPDLIGRDFDEVIHIPWTKKYADEIVSIFRHTLETGEPYEAPERIGHRIDRNVTEYYEWRLDRILLPDGRYGVVCYFRDIFAQVQARAKIAESEERYRGIVNQSVGGIAETDATGRFITVNDCYCEITGYTREELLKLRMQEITHADDLPRNLELFEKLVAGGSPFEIEKRYIRKDGSIVWVHNSVSAIRDSSGDVQSLVAVSIDITERKQMEEALKEADRRKDEFLATLAHELRNPLAPIRHALQIMKLAKNNAEAVEQARPMIDRQLQQMVRLIDDLLNVSRITRGKIELRKEPVNLALVMKNAVETSRPLLEELGHTLAIHLPPDPILVEADITRLAQVFTNLLNNAAKYTEPGGHIQIAVTELSGQVAVSIKDNGLGIPPDKLSDIFELFTQIDRSLERSHSGLGIGLSIVKRLVEMHGGTITAHSEGHAQGSEFVVCLPILISSDSDPHESKEEGQSLSKSGIRRILVADDNEDAAITLAMVLELMGNEVCVVKDGVEAVEKAVEFRPEVILLDIGMPRMNGYEACQKIRQETGESKVVIVALTGWGQEEDKQKSKEAGFDHHLVKPVAPEEIEKMLVGLQTETASED